MTKVLMRTVGLTGITSTCVVKQGAFTVIIMRRIARTQITLC